MARLEDKFYLDDATIHMMLPNWWCFSHTGLKIHKWLTTNREAANNLWRANLLKIVQLSGVPHCPTCRCQKTPRLPSRPLDLEDVRSLRVVKLNPVLQSDDGLIRDSLNGFSCHPPHLATQSIPSMPLEVGHNYLCHDHVTSTVQERTVRYRSPTPPRAPSPRRPTAEFQRSPFRKDARKKKAKKRRRQKSVTPDSTSDSSSDCDEEYNPRQFRSRSPPRQGYRSREAPGGKSQPKKKKGKGRPRSPPLPPPESRTPTPPRVTQAARHRKKSISERDSPGREYLSTRRTRTPPRSPPRSRTTRSPPRPRIRTPPRSPPREWTPPRNCPRNTAPPWLSKANTYPIGVRNKSPLGRESGSAIIRETLRADTPPFLPARPTVGQKTIPVINVDKPQDNEVQQLAGGRPAARDKDEPVAVSRPRQPKDGVILTTSKRIATTHQPVLISIKPDVIEVHTDEEEKANLGSPRYNAPDVIDDDPEFGQPLDPLSGWYSSVSPPVSAIAQTVDNRDCNAPMGPGAEANTDSHQDISTSQEGAGESPRSQRKDQGSELAAVLTNRAGIGEATVALSPPLSGSQCSVHPQPDEPLYHHEIKEDASVANKPELNLRDSSGTHEPDPPGEPGLDKATSETGTQLDGSPLEYAHFFV